MDTTVELPGRWARITDPPGGLLVLGIVVVAWVVTLVRYLRHQVLLSFDSLNNYAHVWYVSDRIWKHGDLPLHMSLLGHGKAFTFPYGFIPWTTAALVRPLFGDWTVTLWMALGALGMVITSFYAFPELRKGWWAAGVLLNPAIIQAGMFGQLSFAWASSFLLLGIGAWRRDKRWAATILVAVAQLNHAAVVLPLAACTVLVWLPWEKHRKALLGHYAVATLLALPAVYVVLASPTTGDATMRDILVNFFSTLGARCLVVLIPLILVAAIHRGPSAKWLAPASIVAILITSVIVGEAVRFQYGWRSLTRNDHSQTMVHFIKSPEFHKGLTYRVLRNGDTKLGLYRLIQAGGKIDSEFFPESMAIRSFPTQTSYEHLLCQRHVDRVLAFPSYDTSRHTNEHAVLRSLENDTTVPARVTLLRSSAEVDVFAVDRSGCR